MDDEYEYITEEEVRRLTAALTRVERIMRRLHLGWLYERLYLD